MMKWEEVRKVFPNQFVKIEVLKSHVEDDKEYIDEMAVIGTVDELQATDELLSSKNNVLVYHTSKEQIVLKIRSRIGLRRVFRNEYRA
ncbi:hypothetical protein HNQ80_002018 [Anaerosolibacter carboniphilus]|uniref:Uncharacterized protein n=1 Tax=Anaerosolibacter carboniphilus TaxID=1417629 RepID=A0A841KR81_9FIRM|nr:hypothetical protein [Anaerosolibacter carboniphilus]